MTVLAKFKGSSGKPYEIREGDDGVTYCTCRQWKFQKLPSADRTCSHLEKFWGRKAVA